MSSAAKAMPQSDWPAKVSSQRYLEQVKPDSGR